jgi:hypothetical protein
VRIFFSNTANQLTLSAGVVASDTLLLFAGTATGWPSSPCKAVIDPDTDLAEVVLITAIGPSSFTVTRGQDGTAAQNHVAGAVVEHRWSAAEADEANLHANLDGGVHGITGDVVGTDDAQELTNKTITSPLINTETVQTSDTTPASVMKAGTAGVNIQEWQDASGVRISRVGDTGEFEINTTDPAVSPLLLKMAVSQTADGFQLRKSDGTVVAKFDKDGNLTAPGLTTAGAVAAGSAAVTGDVAAATVHASGAVSAGSVAATGAVSAASLTTTGNATIGGNVTADNLPQVRTADSGVLIQKGIVSHAFTSDTSFSGTITFPQAFSSATGVIVVGTVQTGSNLDVLVNWQNNPTATGVNYRMFQKDGTPVTGTIQVFWIAIGPA